MAIPEKEDFAYFRMSSISKKKSKRKKKKKKRIFTQVWGLLTVCFIRKIMQGSQRS